MSKLALNQQLWNAVTNNDPPMVEAALVAGADCDFRDTGTPSDDRYQSAHARSVLHEALFLGHTEVARILLSHGAEQTCDGIHSLTPLHLATLFGYESLVDDMIERGAQIDAVDGGGDNLLMTALMSEDTYDRPGFPIIAKTLDPELALRISLKLIAAGCNVNGVNGAGETPLWNAVRYQNGKTVEELIRVGADQHHVASYHTNLVAECAYVLNKADALGQMVWRGDESRAERQRALEVLHTLHKHEVSLADSKDPEQLEMNYPSTKIQREIESWWHQWDREALLKPQETATQTHRTLRRHQA